MGIIADLQELAAEEGVALSVETPDGRTIIRIELADRLERIPLYGRGRTRTRCFHRCRHMIASVALAKFPKAWADFAKPEWIPDKVWESLKEFWCEAWGRGPRTWIECSRQNQSPETGARVGVCEPTPSGFGWVCSESSRKAVERGRYIHCWNNIGRVLTDDGRIIPVSFGWKWAED